MSNKIVGLAIKTLRERAGKTLEQSARQCGHGKSWLGNIESGTRKLTFDDAKILTRFYGADVQVLSDLEDILNANKTPSADETERG